MRKKELLEWFDEFMNYLKQHGDRFAWNKSDDDCVKQIKHAVTVFYNVILPESKPIPKSKVTTAFVEQWARYFCTNYKPSLIKMLKEAGVEVED